MSQSSIGDQRQKSIFFIFFSYNGKMSKILKKTLRNKNKIWQEKNVPYFLQKGAGGTEGGGTESILFHF